MAYFNPDELTQLRQMVRELSQETRAVAERGDWRRVRRALAKAVETGAMARDRHGINPVVHNLATSLALCRMVSPDRDMVLATLLTDRHGKAPAPTSIPDGCGSDVGVLTRGLDQVTALYGQHQGVVKTDNFRRLLMAFAQDIRVIILMIVDRLALMREINHHPDQKFVQDTALESSYLYAPLAHRLGLYKIKGELEDMSLKYTQRETYTDIARQLNETKTARDAYIHDFIAPLKRKLEATGLEFEIKGRTKSIFSIYNKLRKQQVELSGIYDLFAIRVILDVSPEREKAECWNVYSIVADMYTPNPARMKDWLSIPKSNGYESLHTTVRGPQGRWVEVQIRTRRMDLIAEKGLAAHWKYKGVKAEGELDAWMNNVRDILETSEGPMELMRNFKMDIYDKEVFVFTPRGDLYQLPLGASVLDFAFAIHSGLGCQCVGARVNGRARRINHKLRSGDTVEVMTQPTQSPKQDWLAMVVTAKARNKIRQSLNEAEKHLADDGRELLHRRFKNRKIDVDEGLLSQTVKKLGFKTQTEFYAAIQTGRMDPAQAISSYMALKDARDTEEQAATVSAEDFELRTGAKADTERTADSDVLIIGEGIKGVSYKMSRCCNPIFGDDVFGFVSSEGTIKIHRRDCPNAPEMRARYPYRVIRTRWSGSGSGQLSAALRIVGNDDIGIVTNITSIIQKQEGAVLRNIAIDSCSGLFSGTIVVGVPSLEVLKSLVKKIQTVKGVKEVTRE